MADKGRSPIFRHFEIPDRNQKCKCKCNLCSAVLVFNPKVTSNLIESDTFEVKLQVKKLIVGTPVLTCCFVRVFIRH